MGASLITPQCRSLQHSFRTLCLSSTDSQALRVLAVICLLTSAGPFVGDGPLSLFRCPKGSSDWACSPPALKLALPPVPQLNEGHHHPHHPSTQAGAQNHPALFPYPSLPSSPSLLLKEFQAFLPNSLLQGLLPPSSHLLPTLGLPEPVPGNTCLSLTLNPFGGDQMLSYNTRDSGAAWPSHPPQPPPCLLPLTETSPLGLWPDLASLTSVLQTSHKPGLALNTLLEYILTS